MESITTHANKLLPLIAALLLVGCATVPEPLKGDYPDVRVSEARDGRGIEQTLRWGGDIISVEPQRDRTCFEVLQRPLDRSARPRTDAEPSGRFLACRQGFYDPAVFERGREITVIGQLNRLVDREIGDYIYTFPELDTRVVYLWPERRDYPLSTHYYFGTGFGYPMYYSPSRSRFGFGLHYRGGLRKSGESGKSSDVDTTEHGSHSSTSSEPLLNEH